MNKLINNSGAVITMAPLISFHTLVDSDVGLIRLIQKEYLDPSVFDVSFFDRPLDDIVMDLYNRNTANPLCLFSKENREVLDDYHTQFFKNRGKAILELSIITNVMDMISYFNSSNEIKATILYYSDLQKDILDSIPELDNNDKVCIDPINVLQYPQYFFKYIQEADFFASDVTGKTFYISTFGPNLNEERNDIRDCETISKISENNNALSIFNLYSK